MITGIQKRLQPCPTGWGIPVSDTVGIAKEIVDCGLWYLAEYENGVYNITYTPKEFTSVSDYIRKQGRFRHLTYADIEIIINSRDKKWEKIRKEWT